MLGEVRAQILGGNARDLFQRIENVGRDRLLPRFNPGQLRGGGAVNSQFTDFVSHPIKAQTSLGADFPNSQTD